MLLKRKSRGEVDYRGIVMWLMAAVFFLYEFFLRAFVGSIAGSLMHDLQLGVESFALLGGAYYVTYGLMQVPAGLLAQRYNIKWILVIAVLLCALSSFLFSLSQGFVSGFLSRLLMGFGSSFGFVGLLVVSANCLPKQYFGFFAGLSQFIGALGPLLANGPFVAYLHHTQQGWRSGMCQIAVFGIAIAVVVLLVMKRQQRKDNELVHLKLHVPKQWGILLNLLRQREVWAIAIYSACQYVGMVVYGVVWGATYLQSKGLSHAQAANVVSLAWLGYALGCPLVGGISDCSKRRKPVLVLGSVLGVLASCMIVLYNHAEHMMVCQMVFFFMLGVACACQSVGFATIAENCRQTACSTALGVNSAVVILFAAVLPTFVSLLFKHGTSDGAVMHAAAFTPGLLLVPLCLLVSLLVSLFGIRETFCKRQNGLLMLWR